MKMRKNENALCLGLFVLGQCIMGSVADIQTDSHTGHCAFGKS